jgi:hypothetical protein
MKGAKRAGLMLMLGATASCQTRSQAKVSTIASVSVGLIGGYFERDRDSMAPVALISGTVVAILSAASIFILDDQPRTLLDSSKPDWEPNKRDSVDVLAAIRRTRCYGDCAVYTVTIYRDGVVEYRGESGVRVRGRHVGKVSADRLRDIEDRFERSEKAIAPDYVERRCTHFPTVYTWYRPVGGPTKITAHYLGDPSAPRELFELEAAVDDAAGVEQWVGRTTGPFSTSCP